MLGQLFFWLGFGEFILFLSEMYVKYFKISQNNFFSVINQLDAQNFVLQ